MPQSTKYRLVIINQINCPIYKKGEHLILSDKKLQLPAGKPACLILVRNITELLLQLGANSSLTFRKQVFSCSGCQGIIKFKNITIDPHDGVTLPNEIGFSGHLSALPPEELLQTINANQKSGVLFLSFPESIASVTFNNGAVMSACHGEKKDTEAFFSILSERHGFFQFSDNPPAVSMDESSPIGDFMNLLMEGLQKIDETEE